jgi:hypothetical protein
MVPWTEPAETKPSSVVNFRAAVYTRPEFATEPASTSK